MAVITSGAHPKALWPGIRSWFGTSYNEHVTEYTDLFDVRESTKSYEEDVQVTGFGLAPVKPEGAGIHYDSETQGYTKRYTNVAYALGYIVTYEEMKDGLYEKVSMRRAGRLAFSMRQTKENVCANVYNRSTNTSYLGGDGKELLATDHPSKAGTWSNELATAADISEASIEDLTIQIGQAKNDRGLRVSIKPKCLVIPVNLQFEAHRIVKSVLQNDTANNSINAIRAMSIFPQGIKVNHYLTDADAWFVRTDCPDGMLLFERDNEAFQQDNDFDTSNAKANKYERYVPGWTDPRGLYGSPGG